MPMYTIIGAKRETGEDTTLTIEADSIVDAEQTASKQGVLVSSCQEVRVVKSPTAATRSSPPAVQAVLGGMPKGFAKRIVMAILCVLGCLGTFLPWATAPFGITIYGTVGDGWLTLGCFLVSLIICFVPTPKKPLGQVGRIVILLLAVIAGFIIFPDISSFLQKTDDPEEIISFTAQVGVGAWLVAINSVLLALVVLFMPNAKKTAQ